MTDAEIRSLQADVRTLARQLELRAGGQDPMTVLLRDRADAAIALLRDAALRMDRARCILTDNDPRLDCNWGMLDTASIRAFLKASDGRV